MGLVLMASETNSAENAHSATGSMWTSDPDISTVSRIAVMGALTLAASAAAMP